MNKAILYGNVGKDPEVKTLESNNKVAKFSLATNKSYTNKQGEKVTDTAWHNIVLWGKLAELAEKYVKKGNSVIIEGEISYRSYENKDGQTVYITEIIGNALHFAGGKKEETKPEPEKGKPPYKSGFSDINDLPGHVQEQQEASQSIEDELSELPF
jgi:single-strand DNA-binding protein